MPKFLEAARLDQVSSGTGTTVKVAGKAVAVFNIDGDVYAIGDSCPHAGASLGSGKLSGRIVTCRAHGLRYDVTTGAGHYWRVWSSVSSEGCGRKNPNRG